MSRATAKKPVKRTKRPTKRVKAKRPMPRKAKKSSKPVIVQPLTTALEGPVLEVHGLKIDPPRARVTLRKKEIHLTKTEHRLVYWLMANKGLCFSRATIAQVLHNWKGVDDRSIDFLVFGIRKKLGRDRDLLESVRGFGYRFKE